MRIWEFVITGGPCAGKTTGISIVEQVLTKKGLKVFVVAETATELIRSGICPWEMSKEQFQSLLIARAVNKEQTTRKAAEYLNRDVVIIYDRGLLDNKAYMPYEMFEKILAKHGLTETVARDQYDAVFHLVTAADGAEEFYTLENNKARIETPEEARELDKKTREAWVGHAHLRIIDNSTEFEQKIDRLIQEVYLTMGFPVPVETERKFLIKKPSMDMLEGTQGVTKLEIFQTYLHSDNPSIERRIRQRGDGKSYSYIYTEKKKISDMSRQETERRISKDEYLSLLMEGERAVRKYRYCFIFQNQYFELDVYPSWEDEAILEIELTSESQEVLIPEWIKVIKEVTDDPNYKNYNLAN